MRCSLVLATVLLMVPSPAMADVDEALALVGQGRLGEALEELEQLLVVPGNSRDNLAIIYQHLGLLRFAAGDHEGARQALLRLIAVSSSPSLPATAPPELRAMLEEAFVEWRGRTLSLDARIEGPTNESRAIIVTATVWNDVAHMVRGARGRYGEHILDEINGEQPYELSLSLDDLEGTSTALIVELLDEHGGVLRSSSIEIEPDPLPETSRAERGPTWTVGWVLLGLGGLAVGSGIVLVVVDGRPTGDTRTIGDIEQREELDTDLGGWLSLGFGLAGVVSGIILLALPSSRLRSVDQTQLSQGVLSLW